MVKHIHFIGIGGIGMSGIARLFLAQGFKVSGSDLKESAITAGLRASGSRIFIGHNPVNIRGASLVVYSSAIKGDNPEMVEAKRRNLRLIKRAQALAELMKDKAVLTVTGSHGKTTTASLISYLLLEAGLHPTVAIGGVLMNIDTNACLGNSKFFVAEADESDASFLYYRPAYSVITNIDHEHLDYYGSFDNLLEAYRKFAGQTQANGCLFCCGDDINLRRLAARSKNKCVLFGLSDTLDVFPGDIDINGLSSSFDCVYKNKLLGRFSLSLGGRHNISNALAVIAVGQELNIDLKCIKKALAGYQGARRRIEVKFTSDKHLVIDDYAHHPTEIKATLSAIKDLNYNRIIAVFQPHRYSRTKLLIDEFAKSFDLADCVVITDIYSASESPIEGISGSRVCEKIKQYAPHKQAYFLAKEEITEHILKIIRPGDLVVTLGAGDIVKTSDELVERLKRNG